MSKAKYKIVVKPAKQKSGTVLARVPVTIERNDNPTGKKLYQTKAQITLRPQTTRNGQPRPKRRSKKTD